MQTEFIVELCAGVWLAPWSGDPGRTLKRENAKVFKTARAGESAINRARKIPGRNYPDAKVIPAP